MEYAFYQVLHPFVPAPNDKNALAVQKDDVLLISVQSPFLESSPHRKGWLYAYNRCAGTEGYVPVETVKLLGSEKNNTIHHPSAPGVEVADVMPETDKFKSKTSHQLIDLHVLNPVLCIHCNDYIWGLTKLLSRCKGLRALLK